MPTPNDVTMLSPPAEEHDHRTTCPPEESRVYIHGTDDVADEQSSQPDDQNDATFNAPTQQPTPPPAELESPTGIDTPADSHTKTADIDVDGPTRNIPTPMSAIDDSIEEQRRNSHASPLSATAPASASWLQHSALTSPFPSHRVSTIAGLQSRAHTEVTDHQAQFLPNSSSSLLRPGSRFKGNQTSDHQQYEVEVEIKHVDMRDSFLCGYLRIKGACCSHTLIHAHLTIL